LAEAPLADDPADAARVAALALAEDGARDVTTECVLSGARSGSGALEVRERVIMAGSRYAEAVAHACELQVVWAVGDGDRVDAAGVMGHLNGDVRALLRAERPLLNVLQRACGIATTTRAFVEALQGTTCRVLHTRKTAPGLRGLDLSAVRAGGGELHRTRLDSAVLVKDNHWRLLRLQGATLAATLDTARRRGCSSLYVEVESQAELEDACRAGATLVLVDNQDPETFRRWAEAARRLRPGIVLEASGGITLANVRQFALAGADCVSVGALTHSPRAVDIALTLR